MFWYGIVWESARGFDSKVGANRSVAIVLLFLMHRGVDLMSACEYVASARGHILGSGSFPAQLVSIARLRNKLGV